MNEPIDILLTTAKCASRDNPWAHLVTHSISMGYNVSMLWYYQNQIGLSTAMGPGYISEEQIRAYKRERIKHTALGALDALGLLISAMGELQEGRS